MSGNEEKPLQLVQLSSSIGEPQTSEANSKAFSHNPYPFVSLSSVFSHLLLQEFQQLAGFTEPIQCSIILFYFCLGIREACMESSFQNVLTLGCSQVQKRQVCI